MTKFVLMLGGNVGDSALFFDEACRKLAAAGAAEMKRSRIYTSEAVDCIPGTPDFSDAALTGLWAGRAEELLELCQKIECEAGRPALHSSRESRTLDLDLILFGDRISHDPHLTLPHPRAQRRRFVLEPLMEIAPDLIFPDTGLSVMECWKNLVTCQGKRTFS